MTTVTSGATVLYCSMTAFRDSCMEAAAKTVISTRLGSGLLGLGGGFLRLGGFFGLGRLLLGAAAGGQGKNQAQGQQERQKLFHKTSFFINVF